VDHPYFQVGVAVQNLEQAMEELSAALGITWKEPQDRDVDGMQFRVAFADTSKPYLELIEGGPGSPWDATDGSHLHHLGYWSEDKAADMARLDAAGFTTEMDIGHASYHSGKQAGARVELIDKSYREEFMERWGFTDA
jgi:hypothetical protein